MRQLLAALLLLAIAPGTALAAGDPSVRIDSVKVTPGHASLVLTTANVDGPVQVTAGRTTLVSRATPISSAKAIAAPSRAVILVLDSSGSMAGSGIAAARQAALSYLNSLPGDVLAGLLTFSDRPRLVVRPTTSRNSVRNALAQVQAAGNTALYDAVRAAADALGSTQLPAGAQRRLVVLSDGVDTSSKATLSSVTGRLAGDRIPADVVAFRYGNGDRSAAQRIASAAGGRTLTAQSAPELTAAFAEVARNFTTRSTIDVLVPDALAGQRVALRVTVGAVHTQTTVTFAALTPTSTPTPENVVPAPAPHRTVWTWQLLALLSGVFLFVLLAVVLLRWQGVREDATRRLLHQVGQYGPRRDEHAATEAEGAAARTAVGFVGQALRSAGAEQGLARRLDLADVKRKPAEWALLTLCAAAVLVVLAMLLGLSPLLSVPAGLAGGWFLQFAYLGIRISRRRAAFSEQLPDVLQLIVGSLRSGFSVAQAVDAVVRDGTQPAAGEFSRALAETRIGVELEQGLNHVADRMESDDLRWVVMAIRIQRGVGGNLAEVLKNTVDTMRERAQTRRHVHALSAEGRLSGYIIVALPIVLALFMTYTKPEYMRPLYTTPAGLMMVAGSAVLTIIGAFWIRALIKVEA